MESDKKMFIPSNNISYKKIAELYLAIESNHYEISADFVLPQNPKFSAYGNKIAFCQLINTWFKKYPNSKIRIYDNYFPPDDASKIKLIEQLCWNAELHTLLGLTHGARSGIFGFSNKNNDYTSFFTKPLENRLIFDYKELSTLGNSKTFFAEYFQIHPDFFDPDFFINNLTFYTKIGSHYFIKKEPAINEVTKKLFSRIESLKSEISIKWLKNLQTYFYEIFDNTYQWARYDLIKPSDENIIEKSNRIFFISCKNLSAHDFRSKDDLLNIDLNISKFLNINSLIKNKTADIQLLELSILDNGIGIAQTFKKTKIYQGNISITNEYRYLVEAFKFGKTSDSSSRAAVRGIGLNKVIENIENVFLIIRTGHLHLYRDFGLYPYEKDEDFYLFDISDPADKKTNVLSSVKKYPWAEGSLFTFMIPI